MITIAICTYNGEKQLPGIVAELRKQESPAPFEILVVDNNSTDNTGDVIERLKKIPGPSLRSVKEYKQGIPFARNRAIEESLDSDYLFFIDDDEIPYPGWIRSGIETFRNNSALCVGGRIHCKFESESPPDWMNAEVRAFLGEIDHGPDEFRINDRRYPIWSGNIAYDTALFRENPDYRFDARYNRNGKGIGGGSDGVMFKILLEDGIEMAYCPSMEIDHCIEPWKLKQAYFYKLHFIAGRKFGQYQTGKFTGFFLGIPMFMIRQAIEHLKKSILLHIKKDDKRVRQTMTFCYSAGTIYGRFLAWKGK